MVRQAAQNRINHRIKFKIYSTMFLHFKERWIITTSTRLPEFEPVYNQGQDATTSNWRGYKRQNTLINWISSGGIITYELKKRMNGKQLF